MFTSSSSLWNIYLFIYLINLFICFSFTILNLVKKGILELDFITATDICMKKVIDSSIRKKTLKVNHGNTKIINFTITVLNLVNRGLSFYYTIILTGPSCNQFIVPLIEYINQSNLDEAQCSYFLKVFSLKMSLFCSYINETFFQVNGKKYSWR